MRTSAALSAVVAVSSLSVRLLHTQAHHHKPLNLLIHASASLLLPKTTLLLAYRPHLTCVSSSAILVSSASVFRRALALASSALRARDSAPRARSVKASSAIRGDGEAGSADRKRKESSMVCWMAN